MHTNASVMKGNPMKTTIFVVCCALVATIAADALGSERVHGVGMPSRFSSPGSVADAAALCANLGVEFAAAGYTRSGFSSKASTSRNL